MWKIFGYVYILSTILLISADTSCKLRTTDDGSVCVCDSSYCDLVPDIVNLKSGQYQLYTTSKAKLGIYNTTGEFSNLPAQTSVSITISDLSKTHQTIVGFGGAFTDATGINIGKLPEDAQKKLIQSYFADDGIEYSFGRVPIGGTDFSTRGYTYVDEQDETLETFALQDDDKIYKIPYITQALNLRGEKTFRLFASAWSAPIWMKTNNAYNGAGTLKDEYWDLWARYYLKFFDAYEQNGISFWGVTTQNEPVNGITGNVVQNVGFTPLQMREWISKYLGPAIRNSSYSNLKIILHDDQRLLLPILNWFVLSDDEVLKYADGVGVHWYTDWFIPAAFLNFAHSDKKELFLLATEACAGFLAINGLEKPVALGSWGRAEQYFTSIFNDLRYDVVGWTDWNMALDETGGPNWINNPVDSPIIVNATTGEFYKQPMFYALGHFSKFLVPNTVRIDADLSGEGVESLAFKRPDGKIVVMITNKSDNDVTVLINIQEAKESFTISQHSINTLLYSL